MTTTQIKGNVELCETASTVLTAYKPITMGYTVSPTSFNQIGYTTYVPYFTNTYVFSGGNLIYGWITGLPAGTYMCSASMFTNIDMDFMRIFWASTSFVPTTGQNFGTSSTADRTIIQSSEVEINDTITPITSGDTFNCSSPIMISGLFTTICFVTNTFTTGTPSGIMSESYSITRIG